MSERKYGIDLLRITSMFMILVLHILRQGGILDTVAVSSTQYNTAWVMECICMCAVNCYGLISGYVCAESRFRYYKICVLWLQVVFYTLLIALLFFLFSDYKFTYISWTNAIFPVSTKQYWYFTAYFALFFFMPFLNAMLNSLDSKQLKRLALTIIIITALIPTVWQTDIFSMHGGYTFAWLAMLYLLGGIIKKLNTEARMNSTVMMLCFLISVAVTAAFKLLTVKNKTPNVNSDILLSYNSPTMLAAGFSLFIIAAKMKIKSKAAIKIIGFLSPLSFSVYLIHTNTWVWDELKNAFVSYCKFSSIQLFFAVLGTAAVIYLICSSIDLLRFYIFKWLKVSQRLKSVEDRALLKNK